MRILGFPHALLCMLPLAMAYKTDHLKQSTSTLRVITSNVRYDGMASEPVPIPRNGTIQAPRRHWTLEDPYKERPWAERRSRLIDALGWWEPDIIGFQEVLHNQLKDLEVLLGPTWVHVGVGRDDGGIKGEYSPIFFDRERFELVRWGTKWLSKHPDVPGSKDWDAAQTRIATFLTLRDRYASTVPDIGSSLNASDSASTTLNRRNLIHVVNTHYDDQGKKSRGWASWLIRVMMEDWVKSGEGRHEGEEGVSEGDLVIWMGDFNAPTDDPKEKGHTHAVSPDPIPHAPSRGLFFLDTRNQLDRRDDAREQNARWRPNAPFGPRGTYTDWKQPGCEVDETIDLVLVASTRVNGKGVGKRYVDQAPLIPASDMGQGSSNQIEDDILEEPGIRGGWQVRKHGVIDNMIGGKGDEVGWVGRWSDHRAVAVELFRY